MRKKKIAALLAASEEISKAFTIAKSDYEKEVDIFWRGLTEDDREKAFYAVVSKIFDAEIKDKRSYRGVLYDVFGFGPHMYVRGMDCGYMALHNSIMDDEQFSKANAWMTEPLSMEQK